MDTKVDAVRNAELTNIFIEEMQRTKNKTTENYKRTGCGGEV